MADETERPPDDEGKVKDTKEATPPPEEFKPLHLVDDEAAPPGNGSAVTPKTWMAKDWLPTTEALRAAFIEEKGADYLVVRDGSSYVWDGLGWSLDERHHQMREGLGLFCCRVGNDIGKGKTRRTLENGTIVSTLTARIMDRDNVPVEALDRPDLINVRSGTLRGGVLTPHRRADRLTLRTAIAPKPGPCPATDKFFETVFGGDPELIAYAWRVLGYCLSGEVSEQAMFFLWGTGQNGKSTFVQMVREIWGSYCVGLGMEVLTAGKGNLDLERAVAHLRGVHLVVSAETLSGKWNEGAIKMMTGGDRLRGRHMYCLPFEFDPFFKLLVYGNEKPGLNDVGIAMRRRVQLIPFTVTIPEAERDRNILAKLRAEYPQVLTRIINGYAEWQQRGLDPPEAVLHETEEMMSELDLIGEWINRNCNVARPARTASGLLYGDYQTFVTSMGERPMSHRKFTQSLKARGFTYVRVNGSYFNGIELRAFDNNRMAL